MLKASRVVLKASFGDLPIVRADRQHDVGPERPLSAACTRIFGHRCGVTKTYVVFLRSTVVGPFTRFS
jgi:hypothetical protein